MGLLPLLLLLSATIKQDGTALRNGCSADSQTITTLAAGTAIQLRFALSGESVPCYKVAVEIDGKRMEGYLPSASIEDLNSFDKLRREAAWVTTSAALNAARNAQSLAALKGTGGPSPLPASAKVILAQAEQAVELGQPARALALLEPELKKRRDPALLAMAGVAAWRADEARQALDYWREALDTAPNPGLEQLYRQVQREQVNDQSSEKLYGVQVVLRYDSGTVPVDTARAMVKVVDATYARVSSQLGCSAEEKIVTIVQSREAYQKATEAAEWSGGQFDGRIRVPAMNGQQMNAVAEQTLAHETTHACLAMLGEWPSWLHEGMAQKLSGAVLSPAAKTQIATLAKAGQLPKLEKMQQGWGQLDSAGARVAYSLALAAVDALYENFGNDGVRNLMRNPERLAALSAELDKKLGL